MPTSSLYASCSRCVTGPGTWPAPTADPLMVETGQMHQLVEVTKTSSAA